MSSFPMQHAAQQGNITIPIKLTNFPLLAQRQIFRSMEPQDVFILTLFYPRFRQLARSIRWSGVEGKPKKGIVSGEDGMFLVYLTLPTAQIPIIRFGAANLLIDVKIRGIDGHKIYTSVMPSRVAGNTRKITCTEYNFVLLSTLLEKNFNETFLVPSHTNIRMSAKSIATFPRIGGPINEVQVKKTDSNEKIKSKYLNTFLKNNTVLGRLRIESKMNHSLPLDTRLLNIDEVYITKASWFTGQHLLRFTGKHLILEGTRMDTSDIFRFLQYWLTGSHAKLESLLIFSGQFDREYIFRHFMPDRWNPKRRAARYVTTSYYAGNSSAPFYDCTNARDYKRSKDGLLASCIILSNKFFFFTWKNRFP